MGWSAGAGSKGATLGWSAGEGNRVVCWGAGAGRAAVFPAGAWSQCSALGWSAGEGSRGRSGEPETGDKWWRSAMSLFAGAPWQHGSTKNEGDPGEKQRQRRTVEGFTAAEDMRRAGEMDG